MSLNAGSSLWRSCHSPPGFAKFATPDGLRISGGLKVSRAKSFDKAACRLGKAAGSRWHMGCPKQEVVSATRRAPMDYALLTKKNLTNPIIAEEEYEKDFRIRDTGRFHAGWRNRFRLHARSARQGNG
jgi:hypothetical protein